MTTDQGKTGTSVMKVLITGGRAPSALELVRLLAAAGCEVHVAESAKQHLCLKSKAVTRNHSVPSPTYNTAGFLTALEQIIQQEEIDLLVPTCEEIFYVSSGLERLRRLCRVYCAPIEQLRRLHSKWAFIQRAEQLGFLVPMTKLIQSSNELTQQTNGFRTGFVLKPEFSRFAAKVRIIEANECIDALEGNSYPWVAQQRIQGRSICTYSIVHEGKVVAHADYSSDYSLDGGASVYFEPLFHRKSQEWVARFVQEEHFTGQIGFDFIETNEGELYPLECNPRTTSGLHLLASQVEIAQAFIQPERLGNKRLEPAMKSRGMLALPMLIYGFMKLKERTNWTELWIWCRKLLTTRDVCFRLKDTKPYIQQAVVLMDLRKHAQNQQQSIIEASTADIEWNGGPI
ncbi:ATP-grasp domain-containing protein [Paenibacillus sp. SYP-B3998]|uniref:ATP-grasp domain-containing protein n=1 Tax=Paenibacillus sp. SYP-B3998 TaxID=2678564 RepID=A0A6G3ZUF0_9BACL|nr:ATP-grasp domain-containing protein [Paenibacillus sp. SYP-B3998]NEW05745.1 ATP-grasp domain-containing protein [Paenibacillus sp. SYP-B3998]